MSIIFIKHIHIPVKWHRYIKSTALEYTSSLSLILSPSNERDSINLKLIIICVKSYDYSEKKYTLKNFTHWHHISGNLLIFNRETNICPFQVKITYHLLHFILDIWLYSVQSTPTAFSIACFVLMCHKFSRTFSISDFESCFQTFCWYFHLSLSNHKDLQGIFFFYQHTLI